MEGEPDAEGGDEGQQEDADEEGAAADVTGSGLLGGQSSSPCELLVRNVLTQSITRKARSANPDADRAEEGRLVNEDEREVRDERVLPVDVLPQPPHPQLQFDDAGGVLLSAHGPAATLRQWGA